MSETETGGKWTPGPWRYAYDPIRDDWGYIRLANKVVIARANTFKLCTEDDLSLHRENGTDPCAADARLIAASPAMADALEKAIPVLLSAHENDASVVSWAALERARAALKIAKGE